MKPETSKVDFELLIEQQHISLATTTLSEGIRLMIMFYQEARAEGCSITNDHDMLLYEWGAYDWGEGLFFQCDIARQFIQDDLEGDDAFSQLSLRFFFPDSEELVALRSGQRWCSAITELQAFRSFIIESAAYRAVSGTSPISVELEYNQT